MSEWPSCSHGAACVVCGSNMWIRYTEKRVLKSILCNKVCIILYMTVCMVYC